MFKIAHQPTIKRWAILNPPASCRQQARIKINGKQIQLGTFETEAEAHNAYLIAKQIHHVIN